MRIVRFVLAVSLGALVLAAACPAVHAQADGRFATQGIAVSGIGTVKCRPDLAKIEVHVNSKAELTDDALVKFRDSRKRLREAIEGLKLENARVVEQHVSIAAGTSSANYQMMMMNGMGGQNETTQPTEISASVQIELTGLKDLPPDDVLKTVGKVLDTAKDAGGALGPTAAEMNMAYRYGRMTSATSVRFVLRDFQKVRDDAYELAVADARNRGTLLARLYGVKLGRVISVQEVQVSGDNPDYGQPNWQYVDHSDHNRNEISSDRCAEIPVNVRLMVRFDIAEPEGKTATIVK